MKLTKSEAKYRKKLFATFHMKKEEQKEMDYMCNNPLVKYHFDNPYQANYLIRRAIGRTLDLVRCTVQKAGE